MSQHEDNSERDIERSTEEQFARIPAPPPASAEVSGDTRRRVLDEFDRASSLPDVDMRWRRALHTGVTIMSHPASRTILAVAAAAVFLALWLGMPRHSTAFADLLTPLIDAKSAKFKAVVKIDAQPKPIELTAYYLAPHLFRQEFQGTVNTSDFNRGQMLSLDAAHKRATIFKMTNFDEIKNKGNQPGHLFGNLQTALAEYRAHKKGQLEELGEKELNGRRVFGFRLTAPSMTETIWGDMATGNVVSIEATIPGPPKMEAVLSDFAFDVPLDASLFSVDPPADYQVISLDMDVAPATEEEFIAALGQLSDAVDGEFPNSLDVAGFGTALAKVLKSKASGEGTNKEQMTEAFKIGKGMNFAVTLPAEANARYAGKGAKRQGPKAPVFWYKPAGSENYRVIFSDLSTAVADASPEVPGAVPVGQQPAKTPKAE